MLLSLHVEVLLGGNDDVVGGGVSTRNLAIGGERFRPESTFGGGDDGGRGGGGGGILRRLDKVSLEALVVTLPLLSLPPTCIMLRRGGVVVGSGGFSRTT